MYVDSSALLKRVVLEAESSAVRFLLREADADGDLITASSLAWLEVWRSLRRAGVADLAATVNSALSGVAMFRLRDTVLIRARRVGYDELRSLDAIHLASALDVGADSILTYDERLAESAASVGLNVLAPRE
ncbi:MAG: type II toxin-antitoxin system VapC family toxin [Geodermatophilaceae bacterium]|nr:type II toxin-antitoxin system VapC family toxin [Geodermatophilaceae bacterium]